MKRINEGFKCIQCGQDIPPVSKTCRNHCPHCFTSLHVDKNLPGDRQCQCQGMMLPIAYFITNGTNKIHFKCTKCNQEHWNKISNDDEICNLDGYILQYKSYFY